jgi:DNA-binding MarR family transcriptional regulator
MDDAFFRLKRAYHGTLRIGRGRLRQLGLTAARFDMLYALTHEGKRALSMYQSALRRLLGVTRPTVSRMLQSLEVLGLVRRRRSQVDRRQVEVRLTARGWIRIRGAYRRLAMSGWALIALDTALGGKEVDDREDVDSTRCMFEQMGDVDQLEEFLNKIRRGFGDFATLVYPWCLWDD